MAVNGLMANAKPYPLMIDTRFDSSAQAMIKDLRRGKIDAAHSVGSDGRASTPRRPTRRFMSRRWSRKPRGPGSSIASAWACAAPTRTGSGSSTALIQENQPAINKILLDFGVPLLDENDRPIGAETATKSP